MVIRSILSPRCRRYKRAIFLAHILARGRTLALVWLLVGADIGRGSEAPQGHITHPHPKGDSKKVCEQRRHKTSANIECKTPAANICSATATSGNEDCGSSLSAKSRGKQVMRTQRLFVTIVLLALGPAAASTQP